MKTKNILTTALIILLFASCAQRQHELQPCLVGNQYGFWSGLLHGIIAPFSFIVSLFNNSVSFYAVNNNGNWYNFGFVLGAGILGSSASSSSKK